METKPSVLKLSDLSVQVRTESGEVWVVTRGPQHEYWLTHNGITTRLKTSANSSRHRQNGEKNKNVEDGKVISPVTGKVFRVLVKNGDRVSEGQELFGIESMKMQIPVLATLSGHIQKCDLQVGDSIDRGKCVLVIEP